MKNNRLCYINLISRFGLGFLFIYHGLVPKILWLSPLEIELVELSGTGISADIASPLAGVLEIILGLCIICMRGRILPIYIAGTSLVLLLLYSGFLMPRLLLEAFNPVTTNIMGLVLCYIVKISQPYNK